MKLFRCRERLLYDNRIPLIERMDKSGKRLEFDKKEQPIHCARKSWLRWMFERCFSREKNKLEQ